MLLLGGPPRWPATSTTVREAETAIQVSRRKSRQAELDGILLVSKPVAIAPDRPDGGPSAGSTRRA
jgi:hypothetical protein